MAEKKTKIDKLNLKSTNYGDGVATNKPLSVGEFEDNFVTLADAINGVEAKVGELSKGIKLIGLKKELNLNPDTETFDYVNVNYRDSDDKKLTLDFLDHEVCYEVTVEETGFNGTWITDDENGTELFSISQSSNETPSTGAIVSLNIPTSINYATQSVRFTDSKRSGLVVDVNFDDAGQVISYTIIKSGTGYSANETIKTNDVLLEDGSGMTYSGGTIDLTVSEITKGSTTYTFYMNQVGDYSVKLLNDFDGDGDREWSEPFAMTRKYGIFNGQTLSFTKTDDAGEITTYTLTLDSLVENSRVKIFKGPSTPEAPGAGSYINQSDEYDYQLKVSTNDGDFDIRNAQSLFLESMIGDTLSAGDYSMSIVKAGSVIADNDQYIEFDNSGLYIITDIVMTNPTTEISSASGGLFTSTARNTQASAQAALSAIFSSIVAITNDAAGPDSTPSFNPAPRSAAISVNATAGDSISTGLTSLVSPTSYINTQVGGSLAKSNSVSADLSNSLLNEEAPQIGDVAEASFRQRTTSSLSKGGILLVGNNLVQDGLYFNLENGEGSEAYCDVYVFGFLIGESNSDSEGETENADGGISMPPVPPIVVPPMHQIIQENEESTPGANS